jgi:hypothetical protein
VKHHTADNLGGLTRGILLLCEEMRSGKMKSLGNLEFGTIDIELALGHDAIWLIIQRENSGGAALRAAFLPPGAMRRTRRFKNASTASKPWSAG